MSIEKRYHVTFAQTMFTRITVNAADEDAAADLAATRYEDDPIDLEACTFGEYEITEVEETQPGDVEQGDGTGDITDAANRTPEVSEGGAP